MTSVRSVRRLVVVSLLIGVAACGQAAAPYPNRPLTMVVPWGAGGGTDAVARTVAALLEQDLGQPVNVVNRTGGSGVVGHQAIADAAADGYTVGIITSEIAMMHHQGLTTLTSAAFTPLGMVNFDATAIQVRADAPWTSLGDLLGAIKQQPGRIKASGTAHGGIWHVSLYGLLQERGITPTDVPWVPSASSAAGLLDLVAGGVDIVPVSHPEARALIDAGKVKSLAVLDDKRSSLYPAVPTGQESTGTSWKMGVWRGFGAPKNVPDDVRVRLEAAVKRAYESSTFQDFARTRGFGAKYLDPQAFGTFMASADTEMGDAIRAVGLAK